MSVLVSRMSSLGMLLVGGALHLSVLAQSVSSPSPVPIIPFSVEVGFSPDGSAKLLLLKSVRSAKKSIQIAIYDFSLEELTDEMLAATQRGVTISVLVDKTKSCSRTEQLQLNRLAQQGVQIRTVDLSPGIFHDKYMVIDAVHVETGSFNYTYTAATKSAENVLVLWNHPVIAELYRKNWSDNWSIGQPYVPEPCAGGSRRSRSRGSRR